MPLPVIASAFSPPVTHFSNPSPFPLLLLSAYTAILCFSQEKIMYLIYKYKIQNTPWPSFPIPLACHNAGRCSMPLTPSVVPFHPIPFLSLLLSLSVSSGSYFITTHRQVYSCSAHTSPRLQPLSILSPFPYELQLQCGVALLPLSVWLPCT